MKVWVECKNDTFFFKRIFAEKDFDEVNCNFEIICAGGKGKVLNNHEGIRIVDRDKVQHPSLRNKTQILQGNGLNFLDDKNGFIIEIDPELEPWLYQIAKFNRIDPKKFKLPKNIEGFPEKEAKNIFRVQGFKDFIEAIILTPQLKFFIKHIIIILKEKCKSNSFN